MIKEVVVEVDDIEYKVPKEITVSHYGEIMRRMSLSENEIEMAQDILTVILGIPYQILRQFDVLQMTELSLYIQDKITQCDIPYQSTFIFNDIEYGGLNLNKMSFGEYIDLINLVKDQNTIYINIHKICSILYRPILNKNGDKYTIEEYNIEKYEDRSELFKDLPLKYFFGTFNSLFTYFTHIRKEFVVLFGEDDEERPPQDEKDKEEETSNLPWYKMIMSLSDDDFTKIDYVTSRPVVECFNHLTYIRLKTEEHNRRILEQQQKLNAGR